MSFMNIAAMELRQGEPVPITEPPVDPGPSEWYGVALLDDQILDDDGLYNGFPIPWQVIDGRVYTFYKKAGGHAPKGPYMCKRTTLVAGEHDTFQVKVNGVNIETSAHGWCQTPTGRFLIAYQDDEVYDTVKIAYTDGDPEDGFTFLHTIPGGANYVFSISPIRFVIMPSGAIRMYVYRFGVAGNPARTEDIYLTNNGNNWAWGGVVMVHNSQAPAGFGDWRGHEVGVEIVVNTGVDATCQMVALVRVDLPNEGGTYYMHYKSLNGGATWATDFTEDAGFFVNDNGANVGGPFSRHLMYAFLGSNSPVSMQMFNGLLYVFNGERATTGYKLKYTTATPEGAMRNRWDDWTRPVTVGPMYNAWSLGGTIDCGYPCPTPWKPSISSPPTQLWIDDYDVSILPKNPSITEDRCWIRRKRII